MEIPKPHGGGVRVLGVPTIADRVAQTVVAMHLEERADHRFHPDSYGYRPNKSAHQAFAACRQRCWKYDWVIDLDVQKFFDTVPWDLVVKAVKAVTDCRWALLYVERWLAAPLVRTRTVPLSSAARELRKGRRSRRSWRTCSCTTRSIPGWPGTSRAARLSATPTTRSCTARRVARREHLLDRIAQRMSEVGLTLHPEKTRIVYCKDGRRRAQHQHTSFTFLGYAFRGRGARSRNGRIFNGFLPAISPEALKAKSVELRRMRIHRRTDLSLDDLARWLNPIASGWINYYGRFYRTALDPLLKRINVYLRRWAGRKYKRLRTHKRFSRWWTGLLSRQPGLFGAPVALGVKVIEGGG